MAHRTPLLALCAALALALGAGRGVAQTVDAPAAATPAAPSSKAAARPVKRAAKRRAAAPAAVAAPAPTASSSGSYQLVPSGGSALTRARAGSFGTVDDGVVPPGYRKRGSVGIGLGGANGTTPGMSLGF